MAHEEQKCKYVRQLRNSKWWFGKSASREAEEAACVLWRQARQSWKVLLSSMFNTVRKRDSSHVFGKRAESLKATSIENPTKKAVTQFCPFVIGLMAFFPQGNFNPSKGWLQKVPRFTLLGNYQPAIWKKNIFLFCFGAIVSWRVYFQITAPGKQ